MCVIFTLKEMGLVAVVTRKRVMAYTDYAFIEFSNSRQPRLSLDRLDDRIRESSNLQESG